MYLFRRIQSKRHSHKRAVRIETYEKVVCRKRNTFGSHKSPLTMSLGQLLPCNLLLCSQLLELLCDVPELSPTLTLFRSLDVGMLCSAIKHGTTAGLSGGHVSSGSFELIEGNGR